MHQSELRIAEGLMKPERTVFRQQLINVCLQDKLSNVQKQTTAL